jgi:hypothetical protein
VSLFPVASFEPIELVDANELLRRWGHAMGPLERGDSRGWAHVLTHERRPVALATTSYLIRQVAGGGQTHLTRENTCELSRLCAERSGLCRVALRLWREFVFPSLPFEHALSYQDADLHTGATYRFDGWTRGGFSSSGTDARTGKRGRRKWIWTWGGCAECKPDGSPAVTP